MAKICEICKKGTLVGRNIQHKQTGGWAMRAPRSLRKLSPNLRTVKVMLETGQPVRVKMCMKCYKRITN